MYIKIFLNKLFFKYDQNISFIFLKEHLIESKNFYMVYIFSNLPYAVYDYYNANYYSFSLRTVSTALAIFSIAFIIKHRTVEKIRWLYTALVAFIFITEIETQMLSLDTEFYRSSAWLANIIIMFVHSIFFLGGPEEYFFIWLFLMAYYIVRSFAQIQWNINNEAIGIWMYHISTWFLSFIFNLWWFKVRYNGVIKDIKLKEEYEKGLNLEKELATQKERQKIYSDIHDHMGSNIRDLDQLLVKLSTKDSLFSENLKKAQFTCHKIEDNLRMKLQSIEDMEILRLDPLNGIRLLTIRRYNTFKRDINFFCDEVLYDVPTEIFKANIVEILFSIAQENATNDLKYGFDLSVWKFFPRQNTLCLEIKAKSLYSHDVFGTGKGKKNIFQRLKEINGWSMHCIEDGIFHIRYYFPIL